MIQCLEPGFAGHIVPKLKVLNLCDTTRHIGSTPTRTHLPR